MIETIVIDFLISQDIEGIGEHVYAEVPEHPPQEYVLVEKTGSRNRDHISRAMIAVQSISRDRYNGLAAAMTINERVKDAMSRFADLSNEIYACKLNSDYNFTNTETKEHRYQAVYSINF